MSGPVVYRDSRLLPPVAEVARHIRQAWALQELQPAAPVMVPMPIIQVNPQPQIPRVRIPVPRIQLNPPSSARVRVQTPRNTLYKPKAEVTPPPVEVFEEEQFEEDPQIADLHDRVEKFKQTSLEPDAARLIFSAMYVQHTKTESKYLKLNNELVAENLALKEQIKQIKTESKYVKLNNELVAENLALKEQIKQISESLEDALACPITHEEFVDPVMLQDGHTYERKNIEAWFARGKNTSPKTRDIILWPRLVQNWVVKKIICALAPK